MKCPNSGGQCGALTPPLCYMANSLQQFSVQPPKPLTDLCDRIACPRLAEDAQRGYQCRSKAAPTHWQIRLKGVEPQLKIERVLD